MFRLTRITNDRFRLLLIVSDHFCRRQPSLLLHTPDYLFFIRPYWRILQKHDSMTSSLDLTCFFNTAEKYRVMEPVVRSAMLFNRWKEEQRLWREIMLIVQQNVFIRDIFHYCYIKGQSCISNGIMLDLQIFLGLVGFWPHNKQHWLYPRFTRLF